MPTAPGRTQRPPDEKYTLFKERYDVLSQEVSQKVSGDLGMQECRVGQVAPTQAFHPLPPWEAHS